MFLLLFLIQRSINPPSIQRKINAVDITFSNKTAPYMSLGYIREPPKAPADKENRFSGYNFSLIKLPQVFL